MPGGLLRSDFCFFASCPLCSSGHSSAGSAMVLCTCNEHLLSPLYGFHLKTKARAAPVAQRFSTVCSLGCDPGDPG